MGTRSRAGVPFFLLGIVFLAMGVDGRPAFIGIGVAFLVIGSGALARSKRGH